MTTRLLIPLLMFWVPVTAQSTGDFILVKKNHKTIATWFAGSNISITTNSGTYLEAAITKIINDTLFLRQYAVQQRFTNLGVYIPDTVGSYRLQYHYNDIKAIGRTGRKFNLSASAASLIGGALVLALGNGIVYLADREKFSPQLLIASGALGTVGLIMARAGGKGMLIGKKYSLVYVAVSAVKKP